VLLTTVIKIDFRSLLCDQANCHYLNLEDDRKSLSSQLMYFVYILKRRLQTMTL